MRSLRTGVQALRSASGVAASAAPQLVQSLTVIAPPVPAFHSLLTKPAPAAMSLGLCMCPLSAGPRPHACISCQSSHPGGYHLQELHPVQPDALRLAPVAHDRFAGHSACSLCQSSQMQWWSLFLCQHPNDARPTALCLQGLPVIASSTVVTCTGIILFNLMPSDRTNWGPTLGMRRVVVVHAAMTLITCIVVVCCTPLLRRYLAQHLGAASAQDGGKVRILGWCVAVTCIVVCFAGLLHRYLGLHPRATSM